MAGAKHISYGWHTLTILAYDKERNVSSKSVLVYHARPHTQRARRHKKRHRPAHKSSHSAAR